MDQVYVIKHKVQVEGRSVRAVARFLSPRVIAIAAPPPTAMQPCEPLTAPDCDLTVVRIIKLNVYANLTALTGLTA